MNPERKIAIIQSSYIPWKGFFDIIHDVDSFVFFDDVQFTNRDWRTRNRIKTPQGVQWLTIPVGSNREKKIAEVVLPDTDWAENHWNRIVDSYRKAPFFGEFAPFFEPFWKDLSSGESLSQFNQRFIVAVSKEILGLKTEFHRSSEFPSDLKKHDRLIQLTEAFGAQTYVSGPAARDYIPNGAFEDRGIKLIYKEYGPYPEYPQFHPPFEHAVSILDLIFNVGNDAPKYIWGKPS